MICLDKVLFIGTILLVGLLLWPDFLLASRLESIASEISSGDSKKIQQLKSIGITAALMLPLFLMLHLAIDRKGIQRFGAFIGVILLATTLYRFHFT